MDKTKKTKTFVRRIRHFIFYYTYNTYKRWSRLEYNGLHLFGRVFRRRKGNKNMYIKNLFKKKKIKLYLECVCMMFFFFFSRTRLSVRDAVLDRRWHAIIYNT